MARAQATTDHQVIRSWIEARRGHPSVVQSTRGKKQGSTGLLRVDFDEPEDSLEEISWDDFFDTFDTHNLAFLYQDETQSRFHKFVNRNSVDETESESGGNRSQAASGRGDKTRQATPAEQDEAEEADEDDLDEDLDEDESDEDYEDEDEEIDEEEEGEDEDEDEDFDEDDDEDEEDEKPRRGRK